MHQNLLVEIAAVDILEDHTSSKLVEILSLFQGFQIFCFVISRSSTCLGLAFFSYSFFSHFFQHSASIFLPPCNLCVLGNTHSLLWYKNHRHFVEQVFQRNVHFEVWIKERLNNGRISRLFVGREKHAPRTLVLQGGFNFKHCAEWPFHWEQVTYTWLFCKLIARRRTMTATTMVPSPTKNLQKFVERKENLQAGRSLGSVQNQAILGKHVSSTYMCHSIPRNGSLDRKLPTLVVPVCPPQSHVIIF